MRRLGGKNLIVTSPGAVNTLAGDTLTMDGNGTTNPNEHVTVNGVNDVAIPSCTPWNFRN